MPIARELPVALAALACAAVVATISGCFASIDDTLADAVDGGDGDAGGDAFVEASGDSAVDAGGDAPVDAPAGDAVADAAHDAAPSCPAAMVMVQTVGGGSSYCVDATEVTNGAYAAFLNASPTLAGQRAECSWNTSFTPQGWDSTAPASLPVVGVDWCDAVGFCAYYDKRLCGKIGGGAVDSASGAVYDASQGEWFNACSSKGARVYPYGTQYDSQACNGLDYGSPHVNQANAVGQTLSCKGGFTGLFDMSGNLQEWLDSCEVPSPRLPQCTTNAAQCDLCRSGGGGFASPQARLACGGGDLLLRNGQFGDTGFRCCASTR